MMNGYDKAEALAFIVKRIHAKDHPDLAFMIERLISQAIDADMDYMHKTDPKAFITVYSVNGINYTPKK